MRKIIEATRRLLRMIERSGSMGRERNALHKWHGRKEAP
jgi:hypothetical protein